MRPKERKQINHDEETAIRVQAVIEEFSKWRRGPGASRLLAIDAVQSISDQNENAGNKENPSGNWMAVNVVRCRKVVVVECY